jgi:cytochrome P450
MLNDLRLLRKNPLAFLERSLQHGLDIHHLSLRILDVYILNHPACIQHVLLDNHRNYSKDTFQYNLLASITGRGLLTSDGDFWLRQRRLAQPAFHRKRITAFSDIMTGATETMLERWDEIRLKGDLVDVDAEMMRLTLEIVGKALFSVDLSVEAEELTQSVLAALDHLVFRSRNPFSLPDPIPTPRNRKFQAALGQLNQAVEGIIQARRKPSTDMNETGDLLELLMNARDADSGESMEDAQLRDEIITLLIAGHETVASALTWTWYLLAQNPDPAARLKSELDLQLKGRMPCADDLPNLPYTQMVFDEALRLYPPAWIITRKALERDEIGGVKISPGSLIVISPYTIQRHPDFWDSPESFLPERFALDRSSDRPRFAFIPFGGGPRLCIGDSFARVEAQLVLAAAAQRYRLHLEPDTRVEAEPMVTLRPKNGLKMKIEQA